MNPIIDRLIFYIENASDKNLIYQTYCYEGPYWYNELIGFASCQHLDQEPVTYKYEKKGIGRVVYYREQFENPSDFFQIFKDIIFKERD